MYINCLILVPRCVLLYWLYTYGFFVLQCYQLLRIIIKHDFVTQMCYRGRCVDWFSVCNNDGSTVSPSTQGPTSSTGSTSSTGPTAWTTQQPCTCPTTETTSTTPTTTSTTATTTTTEQPRPCDCCSQPNTRKHTKCCKKGFRIYKESCYCCDGRKPA